MPELLEFEEPVGVLLKEIEALSMLPSTPARDCSIESLRKRADEIRAPHLIGLVIAATLFTIAAEALWYGLLTGVDWRRVLQANVMFPDVVRPAWVVLFTTAAITAAALAAQWLWPRERARTKLRPAE